MPLGTIPWKNRLGISNSRAPKASEFANNVLRLPTNILIYQQQLLHSKQWAQGPDRAAAEWCFDEDAEFSQNTTLREISAHDSVFARKNLTAAGSPNKTYQYHRANYFNQLYYVLNEPEIASRLRAILPVPNPPCSTDNCWDARDWLLDPAWACVTNPDNNYWEPQSSSATYGCGEGENNPWPPSPNIGHRRIRANALAYLYLTLWHFNDNDAFDRGHIILPPAAARERLGIPDPASINDDYWQLFFDTVHKTPAPGYALPGCSLTTSITPGQMKALHIHHYTGNPQATLASPLQTVANDASIIREAAEWYRDTYIGPPGPNQPLIPMDIVLSEFGLDFNNENDIKKRYAGWFNNMLDGLSWWNSILCWITRLAPTECKLENPTTEEGGHAVYAAIHNPTVPPYTKQNQMITSHRNQYYYDADDQTKKVWNNMECIDTMLGSPNPPPPSLTVYEGSFTTFERIDWQPDSVLKNWRVTPFGACYAVWSAVGVDPIDVVTAPPPGLIGLNAGWVSTNAQGSAGGPGNSISLTANVILPAGWSTIYFPVIKAAKLINNDNVRFTITTPVAVGPPVTLGMMWMSDTADSYDFTVLNTQYPTPGGTRSQFVYSAMVYPVVCYSTDLRSLTINLARAHDGTNTRLVFLGRPIVLAKACS